MTQRTVKDKTNLLKDRFYQIDVKNKYMFHLINTSFIYPSMSKSINVALKYIGL